MLQPNLKTDQMNANITFFLQVSAAKGLIAGPIDLKIRYGSIIQCGLSKDSVRRQSPWASCHPSVNKLQSYLGSVASVYQLCRGRKLSHRQMAAYHREGGTYRVRPRTYWRHNYS